MDNQPAIQTPSHAGVPAAAYYPQMAQPSPLDDKRQQKKSGILLVTWLISTLIFRLVWTILPHILGAISTDYYFSTGYQATVLALSVIQSLCLLLIPLAITNKTLKIIGFILAIIIIGFSIFNSVFTFIQSLQYAASY